MRVLQIEIVRECLKMKWLLDLHRASVKSPSTWHLKYNRSNNQIKPLSLALPLQYL